MYRNALFCGTLLVKNDEDTIMIQPKHYLRPTNLNEAWEALQQPSSFPLLGGALALGQLKLPYETIVDLQAIEELYTIEPSHEMLSLGSGLTLTQFINLPVPLTHQLAIRRTLPTNIRNNTSLLETWPSPAPIRNRTARPCMWATRARSGLTCRGPSTASG